MNRAHSSRSPRERFRWQLGPPPLPYLFPQCSGRRFLRIPVRVANAGHGRPLVTPDPRALCRTPVVQALGSPTT